MLHRRSNVHCALLSFLVLALTASVSLRAQSGSAAEELNRGVESYKAAHYDEAIAHFRKAAAMDPTSQMAKLYLATALAQDVIPALDTPDNLKTANEAIAVFKQVLADEPRDVGSLKQVAAIYYSIKKLDDAREWQKKVLNEEPNDAEAAYTIGVIDWTQAHQNALKALIAAGLNDDGEGNIHASREVLEAIRAQNADLVEESLRYLQQAIASRPDYEDAMAYLNLTYRRKADIDFDNPQGRDEDVATAKEWTRKAIDTRKAREEKLNSGSHPSI